MALQKRTYALPAETVQQFEQAVAPGRRSAQLVAQDPTDEPVSVLLERIRTEKLKRAAEEGARRGAKGKRTKAAC